MIVFDLACGCGCQFEGWFENRDDFAWQQEAGLLACPRCGGRNIIKILSPVAIHCHGGGSIGKEDGGEPAEASSEDAAIALLCKLTDFVERNFEDVGARLAEESLKIHYGIGERRNIRGVATTEEEKVLTDEGINLLKVPLLVKKNGKAN